jgi:hypothetical protein
VKQVGLKVDYELAQFLKSLSNRSAFIRRAILDQWGMTCPLCRGRGFVAARIGALFRPILEAAASKQQSVSERG